MTHSESMTVLYINIPEKRSRVSQFSVLLEAQLGSFLNFSVTKRSNIVPDFGISGDIFIEYDTFEIQAENYQHIVTENSNRTEQVTISVLQVEFPNRLKAVEFIILLERYLGELKYERIAWLADFCKIQVQFSAEQSNFLLLRQTHRTPRQTFWYNLANKLGIQQSPSQWWN